MMTGMGDSPTLLRRAPRPARYLVRQEAGGWRLYGRKSPRGCGGFVGREDAVSMAERLASEAAFLGRPAYMVIQTEEGAEVRRLRRDREAGDGQPRHLLTKVRWCAARSAEQAGAAT